MLPSGIVMGIEGDDKSGKTTLALTAPKPIFHMGLDVGGYERASHRFRDLEKEGLIFSKSYYQPTQAYTDTLRHSYVAGQKPPSILKPNFTLKGVSELWYEMLTDYADVLDGKMKAPNGERFKSVIPDSWPGVWDLCTRGYLQEKQAVDPKRQSLIEIEYGEPNARMRTMVYAARQSGVNLICPHQLMEVREDRLVDGAIKSMVVANKFRHAGWRHMDKEADLMVRVRFQQQRPSEKEPRALVPMAVVRLCGLAMEVTGEEFKDPTWDSIMAYVGMFRG